jgi:hypothetical protein
LAASNLNTLAYYADMLRSIYTELYPTSDLEYLDLDLFPDEEGFALSAPNH